MKTLHQKEGFRLFATQNPNAGFFKGRREVLSAALLDRFVPVVFQQLPYGEWEEIVSTQLQTKGWKSDAATHFAARIVRFHAAVQKTICSPGFAEVSS